MYIFQKLHHSLDTHCHLVTMKTHVQPHTKLCGIFCGLSATGAGCMIVKYGTYCVSM